MISIKKRYIIITAVVLVALYISSQFITRTYTKTEYGLFDTVCTVTATSNKNNTNKYIDILRKIDSELDIYDANSPICRLNQGEGVAFSEGIFNHIETASNYSKPEALGEYFSIHLNSVYEIWLDAINKKQIPDYDILNIASKSSSSITLGATAKGYATKVLFEEMIADGVNSALINLGGNIYAHGTKPDGSLWTVGIADPKNTAQSALILKCKDISVITSGDYERYFEKDGKRYHHIIDPQTLMPAESGIHSATAIGKDAELCDIMSTALFVAGVDNTKELCSKYGIDAILISDDKIYCTEGAYNLIISSDEKYTLIKL